MTQLDVFPRSSITTKLPTYHAPAGAPMTEEEQQAYREIIVDFVYITWHKLHRPVSLQEIYFGINIFKNGVLQERIQGVRERVKSRIDNEWWPYSCFVQGKRIVRGKRTVDRRVNEAASPDFYTDNKARICAVTQGIYCVNPALFAKKPLEASF
jgi:hypothetical protein